jgi:hypothetical protein
LRDIVCAGPQNESLFGTKHSYCSLIFADHLQGNYSDARQEFIPIALKKLLLPNALPWINYDKGVWCEAARLADCQLHYAEFQNRAGALDVDLAGTPLVVVCEFVLLNMWRQVLIYFRLGYSAVGTYRSWPSHGSADPGLSLMIWRPTARHTW